MSFLVFIDFEILYQQPKNAEDRSLLLKATREAVVLPGKKTAVVLDKSFVDEALIISDMFGLNEIVAVDLLQTSEQQCHFYPDLTRGLISVLLYYDARRSLVNSLKVLVQARKGLSWTVDTSQEVVSLITKYTDKLLDKGLVEQIVGLLSTLNLEKEINLLNENRALGNPRHRRLDDSTLPIK